MRKPPCPTFEAIKKDREAVEALKAFGVEPESMKSTNDFVYDSLMKLWKGYKKSKKIPKYNDVIKDTGLSRSRLTECLQDLMAAGRIIRVSRGVYVPKNKG
jgi:hypothetical protein